MLNPGFPIKFESSDYILNKELIGKVASKNSDFNTEEVRFEDVFTFEIWKKLTILGVKPSDLNNFDILDICAGSGYLSYHLLRRCSPKKLTLLDISQSEINHAREILTKKYPEAHFEFSTADFLNSNYKKQLQFQNQNLFFILTFKKN